MTDEIFNPLKEARKQAEHQLPWLLDLPSRYQEYSKIVDAKIHPCASPLARLFPPRSQ